MGYCSFAQDVIYKYDGSKIQAKVLEVSPATIKYKNFTNLDGPDYVLNKDEVVMIVYKNGEVDVISKQSSVQRAKSDSLTTNFGRHFISVNMFDILFSNFTVSYEWFSKNGYLGIKIPLSVNLNKPLVANTDDSFDPFQFNLNKIISAGVDLNIYPKAQGRVKYFVGSSLIIGSFKDSFYSYNYYGSNNYDNTVISYYYSFLINNGLLLQATPKFNLSFQMGIGATHLYRNNSDSFNGDVRFGFNMGYRFNCKK